MKKLITIIAALTIGVCARAQDFRVPDFQDVRYAPAREEIPEGVEHSDRLLDIYYPETRMPSKGYPTLVFIHGGGFVGGKKDIDKRIVQIFDTVLENGYAIVSIEYVLARTVNKVAQKAGLEPPYNLSSTSKYRAPMAYASEDALLALQFINDHAKEYKLDMSRLAVAGGSAGAMTCLHLTFARHPETPQIKAVVNFWGEISSIDLITDPNIPVLTIHGNQDTTVSYQNAIDINNRLKEIGSKNSKFITLEGRGHAQYAYVGENLMNEVISFLDKNVNPAKKKRK